MEKLKRILKKPRVIILLIALVFSVMFISPSLFTTGVQVQSVIEGSPAANATPEPLTTDTIITKINGQTISDEDQFFTTLNNIGVNQTVSIEDNNGNTYFTDTQLQEAEGLQGVSIGVTVKNRPRTAILQGIDLEGGTRVILEPVREINDTERELVLNNIEQRVNALGLSDAQIRSAQDLDGLEFFIVEVPGVNEQEVVDLLSRQGTFEAKIGNETIFTGGDDITYVCQSQQCSGLSQQCSPAENGYVCPHQFSIRISDQAAERQADATRTLQVIGTQLSENITFFIDGEQVQSLTISRSLQGEQTNELSISGTGTGPTRGAAQQNSLDEMASTQAILQTGSLPVELTIVKTDTISPQLGEEFLQSAILAAIMAIFIVAGIVFAKYRRWEISIPMTFIIFAEVTLLLGAFALLGRAAGFRVDMASIAAIIVAIGSSVDDQIVIADEALRKRKRDWTQTLKKAFFIIMAAYVTLLVAMLPLLFAGAGLLQGFAITSIIGVTLGVLLTRPAYAEILEVLLDEDI